MPATELCSVVIPTAGDRAHLLARSLERLLDDPATGEVVVVFDDVDPATDRLVSDWRNRDPRVRADRASAGTQRNWGEAARNRGARHAKYEIVLGLDDDVVPRPGLVSGHVRWHSERTKVVVLGYMPVALPPKSQRGVYCTAVLYSEAYEAACERFRSDPACALTGLWAGNFSARRDDWSEAADSAIRLRYHGDRALGIRMRDQGLQGIFDPTLRADHFYRRSAVGLLEQSVASGADTALLNRMYPEVRPPQRQSSASQRIALLSSHRVGYVGLRLVFLALSRIASGLRIERAEYVAVKALALIGFERGYCNGKTLSPSSPEEAAAA